LSYAPSVLDMARAAVCIRYPADRQEQLVWLDPGLEPEARSTLGTGVWAVGYGVQHGSDSSRPEASSAASISRGTPRSVAPGPMVTWPPTRQGENMAVKRPASWTACAWMAGALVACPHRPPPTHFTG